MMMVKKTVLSVLLSILLSSVFLASSFAHGGEDHGEKKVVAPTGQMNVKVADTDAVEVVVKYPTPKPAEELSLLVYLTDVKTNAPVEGARLSLAMNYVHPGQSNEERSGHVHAAPQHIEAVASPTDTLGVYEAKVTFPDVGEYNLKLRLGGENLTGEVNLAGLVVPGVEAQANGAGTHGRNRLPLAIAAAVLFISAGVMSYFFWIRPRWAGHAAELKPIYTTVEEYEQ
jgi:hypothetical protein